MAPDFRRCDFFDDTLVQWGPATCDFLGVHACPKMGETQKHPSIWGHFEPNAHGHADIRLLRHGYTPNGKGLGATAPVTPEIFAFLRIWRAQCIVQNIHFLIQKHHCAHRSVQGACHGTSGCSSVAQFSLLNHFRWFALCCGHNSELESFRSAELFGAKHQLT